MNMKFSSLQKQLATFAVSSLLLAACGGGGSASVDTTFTGTWRGNLAVTSNNSCFDPTKIYSEIHQVTFDRNNITLTASDGRVFTGTTTSDNGFTVQFGSDAGFEMYDRYVYTNVTNGSADVLRRHVWNRPGGCVTEWVGTMKRD
jgi:hypothetical protein